MRGRETSNENKKILFSGSNKKEQSKKDKEEKLKTSNKNKREKENNKKLNKKDISKNDSNNKKLLFGNEKGIERYNAEEKKTENNIYLHKRFKKVNSIFFICGFIENQLIKNNIRKKTRYIKKIKIDLIKYILLFFILIKNFSSLFIKCYQREIEYAFSYIDLKIIGTGNIKLYSDLFKGDKPNIIVGDKINFTSNEINNVYYFANSEIIINNITRIWDNPLESTVNMFAECQNIIEINLSNFDSSKVTNMTLMFNKCTSLISLNLSNFNTSSATEMRSMFHTCSKFISLDLSSFNTSNVKTMSYMFQECSSLISLNLSNFDTSNVAEMRSMFYKCSKLNSLDLSNFNTSMVTTMYSMFSGCESLDKLNLSSFITSRATTMYGMFRKCKSLYSLDLSNFDTSIVESMQNIFEGCSLLKYLNLSNFNALRTTNINCIFSNCLNLEYVDLKFAKINSNIQISSKCSEHPSKITICSENEEWSKIFGLSEIQYINCINNLSSFDINEATRKMKCFKKNIELDMDNPCQICGNNYLMKRLVINNIRCINCYEYKEGIILMTKY